MTAPNLEEWARRELERQGPKAEFDYVLIRFAWLWVALWIIGTVTLTILALC